MPAFSVVAEQVKQRHLLNVMTRLGLQREDARLPDDFTGRIMVWMEFDIFRALPDPVVTVELRMAADPVFLLCPCIQRRRCLRAPPG